MKTIGRYSFPENPEEFKEWEPLFSVRAIHRQVLVVAKTRVEGKWNAYCTPVPGQDHDLEYSLWKTEGSKMAEKYARSMFPEFEDLPYAR